MNDIPFDLEAERAVIGSILTDGETLEKATDIINEDDFYDLKNVNIFKAMKKIYEKGLKIDLVTVSSVLKDKLDIIGVDYMAGCINDVPSSFHIEHYSRIVKEKKLLRELIETSQRGILAVNSDVDPLELADELAQKFINLTLNSKKRDYTLASTIGNSLERIKDIADGKITIGIPTGIKNLDNIIGGLRKSDVIILAARPSVGKTSCALSIALNVARQGGTVAVFSLEMGGEQLNDRFLAMDSGVDLFKLNNGINNKELQALESGIERLKAINIIVDDTASPTITDIRRTCRRFKARGKLSLVIIDYLQLIRSTKNGSVNEQTAEISRGLKLIAKELDVPIIALSQLNRQIEGRDTKAVKLSDLRDSGAIEQDADIVIAINRMSDLMKTNDVNDKTTSDKELPLQLSVLKHRNGPIGDADVLMELSTTYVKNGLDK